MSPNPYAVTGASVPAGVGMFRTALNFVQMAIGVAVMLWSLLGMAFLVYIVATHVDSMGSAIATIAINGIFWIAVLAIGYAIFQLAQKRAQRWHAIANQPASAIDTEGQSHHGE
ncbi:hypothetical protein [Novipirellula artificiosorum]|uniref:Uncharacterized protein n=1 Tax=Novipirellula artificiosorum TaxID=2528016 RepID=A0A5C6E206_9BACT|nr:hypothetical protein [Novipirellula artificiosorum]TWU42007.1 hypothetical protein Poly41_03030 [Novipirellula artificiosorum]